MCVVWRTKLSRNDPGNSRRDAIPETFLLIVFSRLIIVTIQASTEASVYVLSVSMWIEG